jgi:hypothetical protein
MAHGLQVFDEVGALRLDVSDRLTKFHSTHTVTDASTVWKSVAITGMADDGTWAVVYCDYTVVARVVSGGFEYLAVLGATGMITVLRV